MKLTLECRAVAPLLSQSREDALPLAIRARMRLHLMTCRACRNLEVQMRFVDEAMHAAWAHPPSDLPHAQRKR